MNVISQWSSMSVPSTTRQLDFLWQKHNFCVPVIQDPVSKPGRISCCVVSSHRRNEIIWGLWHRHCFDFGIASKTSIKHIQWGYVSETFQQNLGIKSITILSHDSNGVYVYGYFIIWPAFKQHKVHPSVIIWVLLLITTAKGHQNISALWPFRNALHISQG